MSAYALTRLAKSDLVEIWTFIAKDSEAAADRVEHAIYDACSFVAQSPSGGHTRADLTNRPVRFWTLPRYPNYTLVYRPDTEPVQIIAVLQGRRDIRRALKNR